MSLVHDIIVMGNMESLIRKYLKTGVMTPQSVNLLPSLSNIMLNKLDREFEIKGCDLRDILMIVS